MSFDTNGPISFSSEGKSYSVVIVDLLRNSNLYCNAYYAYAAFPKHFWISKLGLPETVVTDNDTEFFNIEINIICHVYDIKHKPRTS